MQVFSSDRNVISQSTSSVCGRRREKTWRPLNSKSSCCCRRAVTGKSPFLKMGETFSNKKPERDSIN